jgi:hypothetical protein
MTMIDFPPPHMVFYETLNDIETQKVWSAYKNAHKDAADFEDVDAAVMNSMEDFAKWFAQWTTFAPSRPTVRVRVLMIWHSHFLSLACQQMLRRSLEQRSFRCRVFFHIEEPLLQSAILSRCIHRTLPSYSHLPKIVGEPLNTELWEDPRKFETKLQTPRE